MDVGQLIQVEIPENALQLNTILGMGTLAIFPKPQYPRQIRYARHIILVRMDHAPKNGQPPILVQLQNPLPQIHVNTSRITKVR